MESEINSFQGAMGWTGRVHDPHRVVSGSPRSVDDVNNDSADGGFIAVEDDVQDMNSDMEGDDSFSD